MAPEKSSFAPGEVIWLLFDTVRTTPAHLLFLAFTGLSGLVFSFVSIYRLFRRDYCLRLTSADPMTFHSSTSFSTGWRRSRAIHSLPKRPTSPPTPMAQLLRDSFLAGTIDGALRVA